MKRIILTRLHIATQQEVKAMVRQLTSSLLAFLFTLLAFSAAAGPAVAAGPGVSAAHYRAQPLSPPQTARLIVNDLVWKCGPAGCVTGKSNSRPATDCAALVREIGAVRSFAVAGRSLAAEELEKCNARAR
jgi:hypothetical protein